MAESKPEGGETEMVQTIEHLRKEPGRAYRAIHGYHNAFMRGEMPNDAMRAYHVLTVAAARRFVKEGALDGADYFIGKSIDVLREYLSDSK